MVGSMFAPVHYTIFQTPIGDCAMAWGSNGIVGFRLPMDDEVQLRESVLAQQPHACLWAQSDPLELEILAATIRITKLLSGVRDDLRSIAIDIIAVPPFHRRVYAVTRNILPGQTRTYGEIAAELGEPGAARAVGAALGANPIPVIVPCHRVLAAGGRSGGFTAPGGVKTKFRLLTIEKARIGNSPTLFDDDETFVLDARKRPAD